MLNLDDLVIAIQKSADAAAESIMHKNIELIKNYFYEVPKSSLAGNVANNFPDDMTGSSVLRPKVAVMEYPHQGAGGASTHSVLVPLISLAPMAQLQISDMEINFDMHISELDGKAVVQFPTKKKFSVFGANNPKETNAHIKIKLSNFASPDGVKMVVEGYDKALRAQIPN